MAGSPGPGDSDATETRAVIDSAAPYAVKTTRPAAFRCRGKPPSAAGSDERSTARHRASLIRLRPRRVRDPLRGKLIAWRGKLSCHERRSQKRRGTEGGVPIPDDVDEGEPPPLTHMPRQRRTDRCRTSYTLTETAPLEL